MENNKFPVWKYRKALSYNFIMHEGGNQNRQFLTIFYSRLRGSCDSFIKKPAVRQYIFNRDGHKCKSCGSEVNLQIDHIISVRAAICIERIIDPKRLNDEDNLQTLCASCNAKKPPIA